MGKIHILFISLLVILISSISLYIYITVFVSEDNNKNQVIRKSVDYYENVWEDNFLYYQNSEYDIPLFGAYEFSLNVSATGDVSELKDIYDFEGKFSNIGVKLFGDYDFSQKDSLSLNGDVRVYINSSFQNKGDIDISYELGANNKIFYTINNFDTKILKILGLKYNTIKAISSFYEKNKGKQLSIDVSNNFLGNILNSIKSSDSTLYENTEAEEKKIAKSFVKNDVINVYSGKTINNTIDKVLFRFDSNSFIEFMEDVSKIIGEKKTFQQDKQLLKNFVLNGFFKIKDNIIIDSKINSELPVKLNNNVGVNDYELLLLQTRFKLPDPNKLDFSIVSSIKPKSSPENILKINLKGKIK